MEVVSTILNYDRAWMVVVVWIVLWGLFVLMTRGR